MDAPVLQGGCAENWLAATGRSGGQMCGKDDLSLSHLNMTCPCKRYLHLVRGLTWEKR